MTTLPGIPTARPASELVTGDTFIYRGTTVTVLHDSEPTTEPFRRPGFFRLWCSRADTGAEGWMVFGPNGAVSS